MNPTLRLLRIRMKELETGIAKNVLKEDEYREQAEELRIYRLEMEDDLADLRASFDILSMPADPLASPLKYVHSLINGNL